MENFILINKNSIEPLIEKPLPEKLISGNPVFTTWNQEQTENGVYSGIWRSTVGKWKIKYDEWEYCHIVSGVSVLENNNGEKVTLEAGDSFIIKPGFNGSWEVIETTVKEYVIVI